MDPKPVRKATTLLFGGVRLEACEIVKEAQGCRVESSGRVGDHRHEPVVLSVQPLVILCHLGAVGLVERVLASRERVY